MVFSSIPVYLDPPNWHQQQQQNHHPHNLATTTTDHHHHQLPPLPPPPPSQPPHAAGTVSSSGGSIRPGSMADRARLAKIPQPESALKCPRCESSNTKFCYFNNYSLTQPRHFCKTCRRYWTRGGALRTVPVGGGCRRNKKSSKSSGGRGNSKSPATTATTSTSDQNSNKRIANPSGVISPSLGATAGVGEMIGHFSQNPFMAASIQNLARFGGHGSLGLNFCEMGQAQAQNNEHGNLGFQVGPSGGSGDETSEDHQWRLQQFSLFGGGNSFEPSSSTANLYPLFSQGSGMESQSNGMVGMMMSSSGGSRVSELISSTASVKLEGRQGLNLSSPPSLAISESNTNNNNNNSFWAGNSSTSWTDLSGLNSSSTSHLL